MKLIFITIIALVISSVLAYQVHLEPGYALLSYGTLSVETSLAVLVFITLFAFSAFYLTLRTLLTVKRAPKSLGQWNTKRKQANATKALNKGLIDSAEGNWQQSERLLVKHAKNSDTPLLNYLSAAHAAQSQNAYDRRDDYLFKAGEALPEQIHAIHLTRAKLQLAAGQLEQALATLQQLKSATPKHPIVLTLLMNTLQQLGDWHSVYTLLPSIKNNRKISQDKWQAIEHETLLHLFSSASMEDKATLAAIWKTLDKTQKLNADYLAAYTAYLIKTGKSQIAEELILKGLKNQQTDALLNLYSQLNIDINKKIHQLEKWLKSQETRPTLLNTLAKLCLQQKLWGKAKTYLDKSLSIQATSQAYLLLGEAHEQLDDDKNDANAFYKMGLELSLNGHAIAEAKTT
ncbi:MAG: heme biosynthesis HemY N-terminal domain-containing protein [Cycloclasticus sp.]